MVVTKFYSKLLEQIPYFKKPFLDFVFHLLSVFLLNTKKNSNIRGSQRGLRRKYLNIGQSESLVH